MTSLDTATDLPGAPETPKVLVADDDPVHRRLVEGLLRRWGQTVEVACDGQEALDTLEQDRAIRLAILDWMMPKLDGLEVCQEIRRRYNEPYIYTILLTARDNRDDVVAGLDAGADDYLTKPVHHAELHARVRAGQRIIHLQAQLLAAKEAMRVQAMHDALTGIFNRGAIFDALSREMDRARRDHASLAVLMIDLDHFKQVNDQHGHQVGDEVLRETARRIQGAVRSYDAVGRYGGEEFLVVAHGHDSSSAMAFAERLRCLFEEKPIPTQAGGPALRVTLSLGVVTLPADHEVKLDRLIGAADEALYRAKNAGRNRVEAGRL